MLNENAKKLLKQIDALLPLHTNQERRYLKDLENNVSDYIAEHPNATLSDLELQFGSANNIVHEYIESFDTDYIIHNISRSRFIRKAIISILVLALLTCSFFWYTIYQEYLDVKNSIVVTEEITID